MLKQAAAASMVLAALVTPAQAHAVIERNSAPAGSYYKLVLAVPHGCEGSPTLRVRVKIPEGVLTVKPQPKPGWELSTQRETLSTPAKGPHGNTIKEIVTEVMWTGRLADEHFDEFTMQILLPDRPGTTIYFPTVQECEKGAHRWIEIPRTGQSTRDLKEPAPAVTLSPKRPAH